MVKDTYYKLRNRLDQYSLGFAATESEVEIKILEKLFNEEEAELYLSLTLDLQAAKDIAEKINKDPEEVERILQRMTEKGHTFPRFPKKEGEPFYYAAAPFFHGILEHQLKRLDPEMAEMLEEHFQAGNVSRGPIALRNIPVNTAVHAALAVAPYDDLETVIRNKDRIALADCVCTTISQHASGQACDQPAEVCLMFDFYADYYVARGMGRLITQEEALAKLDECEEAGLVPQLSNSENPEVICNCCPDCCGGLRALKKSRRPGLKVASNYYAAVSAEACGACELCFDRCPMEAISMGPEDVAQVNRDRCIGCGLCVGTCPDEALNLKQKTAEEIRTPPQRSEFMKPSVEFENSVKDF